MPERAPTRCREGKGRGAAHDSGRWPEARARGGGRARARLRNVSRATYHVSMSFLRRRSAATPAGPDFDVLAMDPGDWPGNLGAGLLPAPDGSCQGVFLRYDLYGGRGPAMIIGNLPEGSPARETEEGQVPFEVAQLLLALENDEPIEVVSSEDVPVMQGDNLLIVRRVKLSESRIACVQFDRSDGVLVTIASWDRPITDDLYTLLKPLPPSCSSRAETSLHRPPEYAGGLFHALSLLMRGLSSMTDHGSVRSPERPAPGGGVPAWRTARRACVCRDGPCGVRRWPCRPRAGNYALLPASSAISRVTWAAEVPSPVGPARICGEPCPRRRSSSR